MSSLPGSLSVLLAALAVSATAAPSGDRSVTLRRAEAELAKIRTVETDIIMTMDFGRGLLSLRGKAQLRRPNYWRVLVLGPDGRPSRTLASTGKTAYEVGEGPREYTVDEDGPQPSDLAAAAGLGFGVLLDPTLLRRGGPLRDVGTQTREGRQYRVLERRVGARQTERYFFTSDAMLAGTEVSEAADGPAITKGLWFRNLRRNPPLRPRDFAFAPPAGFRRAVPAERSLLAVGQKAPDFQLRKPGGGDVTLSEALSRSRVVLVNFWFTTCAPCRAEFPVLDKMYSRLRGKGLEIIAVNAFDNEAAVEQFQREVPASFPLVLGSEGRKCPTGDSFGVKAYPANFLIGPDGKILWRGLGLDEAALREALRRAGIEA